MHKPLTQLKKERKFAKSSGGSDVFQQVFTKELSSMSERVVREIATQIATEMMSNGQLLQAVAHAVVLKMPIDKMKGDKGDSVRGQKGDKGDTGEKPTVEELLAIIKPLIPEPVKGDKGEDFFTEAQKETWLESVVATLLSEGIGSGIDIVSKVNALDPSDPKQQIDASHIKNLPKANKREGAKLSGGIARGGLKLIWNTQLEGAVNGVNTMFTLPASSPNPVDNKYLVEARGVLKTVDGGDFSITNNNRTITFVVAPPNGSARPRIYLYQAH